MLQFQFADRKNLSKPNTAKIKKKKIDDNLT
jgi:hypothetical protein